MWIVHPHHPLAGQRVRVIRRKGADATAQWVIQLDDQTHACIPASWAVPDDDSGSPPAPGAPAQELRADVTGLLVLARMVQQMSTVRPTEEESDETTSQETPGSANAAPPSSPPRCSTRSDTARLAHTVPGAKTSPDRRPGSLDGQTAAGPTAPAGGE